MKFNRFSCCRNSRKHTVRRFIQSYWWISARSCNFSRTCSWKNHLHDFMKTGPWAPRLKCVFNILVLPIFALLPGFCFEEFFKTFYRNNKNHYVQFRTYKIHLNIQKIFSKIQRKIDDILIFCPDIFLLSISWGPYPMQNLSKYTIATRFMGM